MTSTLGARTAREEFRADWPLLGAAMMGAGLSAVLAYAVGVLITPISRDFGWSPQVIVTGFSVSSGLSGLGAIFTGKLIARFGARHLTLAGTGILALATVALGLIPRSVPLYFGCYVLVALGHVLLSPIVWQKIVIERFDTARGLAVSIVLCGPNIAGAAAPLLATEAVYLSGWRMAYFALAGYIVATLPLTVLYFRETRTHSFAPRAAVANGTAVHSPPAQSRAAQSPPAQSPPAHSRPDPALRELSLRELARIREFWLMCCSFMFAGVGMAGYTIHLAPILLEKRFSTLEAASMVSALSVSAIVGRLLAGFAMDRLFAPRIAAAALALPLASCVILSLPAPASVAILFAAILLGLASGAEYNMIAFLTARYFGLNNYGTVGGILFCLFTIGCLTGQQLPGFIGGGYAETVLWFGASFLVAATTMLFCRPYPDG